MHAAATLLNRAAMESRERSPEQIHGDGHVGAGTGTAVQIISHHGKGRRRKKERLLDFLRAAPSKGAFLARAATLRTRAAAMPAFQLARVVDWRAMRGRGVAWARHPMNAALLVWLGFVAAGMAFVFLIMVGALDSAVPDAARRQRWAEVANQMLNALFTVMCVYQHPQLCHHLALLARWRAPADVAELRAVYCKNCAGGGIRRERFHVAAVVLLLHATCLAQYGYCALFWCFRPDARPGWAVNLCMALGLGAPVVAAVYMVYGPLGRKVALPPASSITDEESGTAAHVDEAAHDSCRVVVPAAKPEWAGGLLDLADDPTVAALSVSCTFCVFGWNMERLGMGNMYVHAVTLALLWAAPVLVFTAAARSMRDPALGYLVGAVGALLAVLGLTYGGFWRARMRRRFGLPADDGLCGGGAAADYARWVFCAPCALAQEVRTGNLYDVEGGGLYVREEGREEEEEGKPAAMAPLEREGRVAPLAAAAEKGGECGVAVDAPPLPVRMKEVKG